MIHSSAKGRKGKVSDRRNSTRFGTGWIFFLSISLRHTYIFSYLKWSDFVLDKLERVDIVPHHVQDLALESSEELFQL